MNNILENYTQTEATEFVLNNITQGKRIEKHDNTIFALSETEIVKNGQIIVDNERPNRLREEQFKQEFFNTSLGWVRRAVHMQNGEVWNFLKDIKPNLIIGQPIITYTPNEDYSDLAQNRNVLVTEQFLQECGQQIIKDFYGE